jgi:hypothetical protein
MTCGGPAGIELSKGTALCTGTGEPGANKRVPAAADREDDICGRRQLLDSLEKRRVIERGFSLVDQRDTCMRMRMSNVHVQMHGA